MNCKTISIAFAAVFIFVFVALSAQSSEKSQTSHPTSPSTAPIEFVVLTTQLSDATLIVSERHEYSGIPSEPRGIDLTYKLKVVGQDEAEYRGWGYSDDLPFESRDGQIKIVGEHLTGDGLLVIISCEVDKPGRTYRATLIPTDKNWREGKHRDILQATESMDSRLGGDPAKVPCRSAQVSGNFFDNTLTVTLDLPGDDRYEKRLVRRLIFLSEDTQGSWQKISDPTTKP